MARCLQHETDHLDGLCPLRSVTTMIPTRRTGGTVRGTTREIIPAQLVQSVRLPVPFVQLACVLQVAVLLIIGCRCAVEQGGHHAVVPVAHGPGYRHMVEDGLVLPVGSLRLCAGGRASPWWPPGCQVPSAACWAPVGPEPQLTVAGPGCAPGRAERCGLGSVADLPAPRA